MKITDALRGEHAILYAVFDRVERALPPTNAAAVVREQAAILAAALLSHAKIEDQLLLPALARSGDNVVAGAMAEEHESIAQALAAAHEADDVQAARGQLLAAVEEARAHFAREEQMLFPSAEAQLGRAQLEELGRRWAVARGVAVAED